MKCTSLKAIFAVIIITVCIFPESAYPCGNETKLDNKLATEIYAATYHFHFREVDSLIVVNDHLFRNSLPYNLAVINYHWWRLISGEQNKKYAYSISERIETIEGIYSDKKSNIEHEQLFMLISIFAFDSRVSLIDNSYFAAISSLSEYYSFLKMSFGLETNYNPFYLTSGLYYFFAGLAKERAPLLSPFLALYAPGNSGHGLYFLKKASLSNDQEISHEAKYFLMKIYFDVYKNYTESAKYCSMLLTLYPENLLYQQYMFRNELSVGNLAKAKSRIILMENVAKSNNQLTNDEKEYYIKLVRSELSNYQK